jgi:hypothetical protein
MRRRAPMRWIEEAEARKMWLHDAESKPAAAPTVAGPEFLLATKATLTVLVARMTGRVARTNREQPSADGNDASADGCDYDARSWPVVCRDTVLYPLAAIYPASFRVRAGNPS